VVGQSLVIKTFTLEGKSFNVASADASAWDYWKREWLSYQAPWLQALDGSLVAPRCLGVGEGPSTTCYSDTCPERASRTASARSHPR